MGIFKDIYKKFFYEPTLRDTFTEKIGGGPHGYGDPEDWSLRDEEYFLFPRMVWKKVRYEKCKPCYDRFYRCVAETDYKNEHKCQKFLDNLEACRKYYFELKNDEVELECVKEYLVLRNEFRRTADPKILESMKDMMLTPSSQVDMGEVILNVSINDKLEAENKEKTETDKQNRKES